MLRPGVIRSGVIVAVAVALSVAVVGTFGSRSDAESVCGSTASPPLTYKHVVVIMEENRTWSRVGGPGFSALPYLHSIATQCAFYTHWLETNPRQSSLTQYIGLTSGVDNPATVNDCSPSVCHSTDNNIFRQVRDAGGTARTYVERATTGCQAVGNPANVPALYYVGDSDDAFCKSEVRPLAELDVNRLPTFAMIIPSLCHNGHDCDNSIVDHWLKVRLARIIGSESYRAGNTAVLVLYDEDRPVPNLLIAPTAHEGALDTPVADHSAALGAIEQMLGLSVLPTVRNAVNLRASAHI
jgi:hypothetical protein